MLKLEKINSPEMNIKVYGQGCMDDCEETIWAGKTAAEGWQGGCWSTIGNTPRTTTMW